MARKKRINFNIDKIKLCYKQPSGIFQEFANKKGTNKKGIIYKDDYDLKVLPDESDDLHIKIAVNICGSLLGNLTLNNSKQCEGLCFFRFDNKALYEFLSADVSTGQKYNMIGVWELIADDLGLEFNNITELEVACDCNLNLPAKVRKLIRDFEHYEMFCNGKKVDDPNRTIDKYHEVFNRSRKRLQKHPSIYIEQARKDGPLLRIYNKTKEIEAKKHTKDYISEWNMFATIFRAEVRLKSLSIKEFLNKYTPDMDYFTTLQMIQSKHFLVSIWDFFADRLLFFRDMDGNDIHLSDLLGDLPTSFVRNKLFF